MDIIDQVRALALELQKDERYLVLENARRMNDADEELQQQIGEFNLARIDLNNEVSKQEKNAERITELNEKIAAPGTAEKLAEVEAGLADGSIKVFDTSTFTVDGQPVTSYMADVDTDPDYTPDTEVVQDGYLAESTARSAPYFQLMIDGIDLLDTNFG